MVMLLDADGGESHVWRAAGYTLSQMQGLIE
jgi:hypothetical protein